MTNNTTSGTVDMVNAGRYNRFRRGLVLYLSSIIVYSLGIALFRFLPYYQRTLSSETQATLLYFYVGYLILSPFYYLLFTTVYSTNKPYLFLRGAVRYLCDLIRVRKPARLENEEKVALFFILVKLFFLPLMINFFHANLRYFLSPHEMFYWYPFALTLIFTVDTFIFALGYTFEFRSLNNVVKSVEPTLFGWIVALISYPPFNSLVGSHVPWGANDYVIFGNETTTFLVRLIITGLLIIYLWASLALGPKASNLTNRGIVTKFPYSLIRHPAYTAKNLVWWITLLPVMNWQFALGMGFWTMIYFFRAITEERHLNKDRAYQEYCDKVRYRFIPYVV